MSLKVGDRVHVLPPMDEYQDATYTGMAGEVLGLAPGNIPHVYVRLETGLEIWFAERRLSAQSASGKHQGGDLLRVSREQLAQQPPSQESAEIMAEAARLRALPKRFPVLHALVALAYLASDSGTHEQMVLGDLFDSLVPGLGPSHELLSQCPPREELTPAQAVVALRRLTGADLDGLHASGGRVIGMCSHCGDEGGTPGAPCGRDLSEEMEQPEGSVICPGRYI